MIFDERRGGCLDIKKHVFILFDTSYPTIQQMKPYNFFAAPQTYLTFWGKKSFLKGGKKFQEIYTPDIGDI